MICSLVAVSVVLFFYYYLYKPQTFWKNKNVKQGTPVPLLGDGWRSIIGQEAILESVMRLYNQFKDERYFGMYQTTLPTFVVRDLELIKQITVKDFDHFMDHRQITPENVDLMWTKNLFSLKGNAWRDMRMTLSPTFTCSKMRAMFVLMEKSAQQYVNFYLGKNEELIELELKDSFTRVANDVIANCAFGITVDSLKEPENDFYLHGKEATNFTGFKQMLKFMINMMAPKIATLLRIGMFSPKVTLFFSELIRNSVKLREEQNIFRPDMINLLMEARKGYLHNEASYDQKEAGFHKEEASEIGKEEMGEGKRLEMTDIDMAAQVLIFFFAGFDTISTTMSFTCYELAIHPEIQNTLRQEIDRTNRECRGKLTYDILNQMKYLDMVISESLRKNPPAITLDRVCTKPYTIKPELPGEHPVLLLPGDVVWVPVIGVHHDEELYPNAGKFDPERFSNDNIGNIKPYSYIPFGTGPRNCIGSRFALMECKTLLYYILSKFELTVITRTIIPMKYAKNQFNPTMEGGFWIGFKRREHITNI